MDCSWAKGEGLTLMEAISSSEGSKTWGVLAGVGARSRMGEWTMSLRWRKGRLSSESFESSASSWTFWRSVLTWPRSKFSPEPGVLLFLALLIRFLVMADEGVSKPPVARPMMGESFVTSIKGRDFGTPFSESSIFPVNKQRKGQWKLKTSSRNESEMHRSLTGNIVVWSRRSQGQSLRPGDSSCCWRGLHGDSIKLEERDEKTRGI